MTFWFLKWKPLKPRKGHKNGSLHEVTLKNLEDAVFFHHPHQKDGKPRSFYVCFLVGMIEKTHIYLEGDFCDQLVGSNLKNRWFPTITRGSNNESEVTLNFTPTWTYHMGPTLPCLAKNQILGKLCESWGTISQWRGPATMARLVWVRMVTCLLMVIGGKGGFVKGRTLWSMWTLTRWWFEICLFSPLPGEMIKFD